MWVLIAAIISYIIAVLVVLVFDNGITPIVKWCWKQCTKLFVKIWIFKNTLFRLAIIISAAVVLIAGVVWYWQNRTINLDLDTNIVIDTSDWQEYIDDKNYFRFKYPIDWELKNRNDSSISLVSPEWQPEKRFIAVPESYSENIIVSVLGIHDLTDSIDDVDTLEEYLAFQSKSSDSFDKILSYHKLSHKTWDMFGATVETWGKQYEIFIENDGRIIVIFFADAKSLGDLSDAELGILDSFVLMPRYILSN